MTATIEQILGAPDHGFQQAALDSAEFTTEAGMVGDRHAGDGIVSLIEAEAVDAFNDATGLSVTAADTGRNLVTRGARLNPLVGRRFRIGDVTFEGTELCEPCATLGAHLATADISAADIVRHFAHSAGIRARVISAGSLAPGSTLSN